MGGGMIQLEFHLYEKLLKEENDPKTNVNRRIQLRKWREKREKKMII